MAFSYEPSLDTTKALSCYRPVQWGMSVTVAGPNIGDNAKIEVYQGATLITSFKAFPLPTSSGTTYLFKADIQAICRDLLPPFTNNRGGIFPTLNSTGQTISNQAALPFSIVVTYKYRTPTGALVDLGITDTSSEFQIAPVTRQHEERFNLLEFYGDYGIPRFMKPLTHVPNAESTIQYRYAQKLGRKDNMFLAVLDNEVTWVKLVLYSASGILSVAVFQLLTSAFHYRTVGVGLVNLQAPTVLWYLGIAPVFPSSITAWEITFGKIIVPFPTFVPLSDHFLFEIQRDCHPIRIYWMNRLAGCDAYNFVKIRDTVEDYKVDFGESPLSWSMNDDPDNNPHNVNDVGLFKINPEIRKSYEITETVDYVTAQWLIELFSSPKTFTEVSINNTLEYVPVLVRDMKSTYDTTKPTPEVTFNFTLEFANSVIVQTL